MLCRDSGREFHRNILSPQVLNRVRLLTSEHVKEKMVSAGQRWISQLDLPLKVNTTILKQILKFIEEKPRLEKHETVF